MVNYRTLPAVVLCNGHLAAHITLWLKDVLRRVLRRA